VKSPRPIAAFSSIDLHDIIIPFLIELLQPLHHCFLNHAQQSPPAAMTSSPPCEPFRRGAARSLSRPNSGK